ncbi:hypothetical protein K439DRAFT_1650745 [Ramaria rubella]|nr:hypothetical protein K439DRAFT_1650745 [Ramaria rubella]
MNEPPRLSLERPYKNDKGEHILNVIDITQEGDYILEPRESVTQKLGDNFNRIFTERGVDFFEKLKSHGIGDDDGSTSDHSDAGDESLKSKDFENKQVMDHPMTPDELFQMRKDMLPQLHVALGEMSQARDMLTHLLSTRDQPLPIPGLPVSSLKATTITKPPDIPSVQAFNSQLILGGKDEALRKSAAAFKSAANSMERVRLRSEKYWGDALKTRNANWGLVPAPLPPGAPTGKGADKTARDFWITFGLAESPSMFKRRAMAHLAVHDFEETPLRFPRHQATRMRVSLLTTNEAGQQHTSHDTYQPSDDSDLNSLLRTARNEVVDQEIFTQLIREAAMLPTAAVSVSERLIVIEAAQNSELRFELVENEQSSDPPLTHAADLDERATCDLIHHSLVLLLLRAHAFARHQRLSLPSSYSINKQRPPAALPPLLLPVFNMLQYKLFCKRVEMELNNVHHALSRAGVPSKVRFNAVGETGMQLVDHLRGEDRSRIGGDAILRVDNRHTLHFNFLSPSSLVANLSQATLTITSVPQLSQVLKDEVERCLLDSICRIGTVVSAPVEGSWFVDKLSSRCVGRWDATVLTSKLQFTSGPALELACSMIEVKGNQEGPVTWNYGVDTASSFLAWVEEIVSRAYRNAL